MKKEQAKVQDELSVAKAENSAKDKQIQEYAQMQEENQRTLSKSCDNVASLEKEIKELMSQNQQAQKRAQDVKASEIPQTQEKQSEEINQLWEELMRD